MKDTEEERKIAKQLNKISRFIKNIPDEQLIWAVDRMNYEMEKRHADLMEKS